MEGEFSCYGGGQFNRGKMVLLQRWSLRENGYVTEVDSFMEGECLCYGGGQFNGGSKIMLGGQFNLGRMVMLRRWSF